MAENRELALVLKLVADQFQSELRKSSGLLGEFSSLIRTWQFQFGAAGSALFALVKSTANFGEELVKTSQKTGIAVEALSGLEYAAKLSDLSNETLVRGLKTLSQNMVEAATHTGDGEAVLRRFGLSATDSSGKLKPTQQMLLEVADVFAKHADGAGKAEAAVKLFGKAGMDLIPFLNQGKSGITQLMTEAERLGVVMSTQDAEAANTFNDRLKELTAANRGLSLALGRELLPAFTQLVETMRDFVAGPVGTGIKLFFQGLATTLSSVTVAMRYAVIEWQAAMDKWNAKDQPGLSRKDQMKIIEEQRKLNVDDIMEEWRQQQLNIFPEMFNIQKPITTPSGGADSGKPAMPIDRSVLIKAQLKAEFEAKQAALTQELALTKATLDQEQRLLEQRVAEGEVTEIESATRKKEIDAASVAFQQSNYTSLAQLAKVYYDQLIALESKTEEKTKLRGEQQKLLTDLAGKQAVTSMTGQTTDIGNQTAIDSAKARDTLKQIQLLSTGATSELADLDRKLQGQLAYEQAYATVLDQQFADTTDRYAQHVRVLLQKIQTDLRLESIGDAELLLQAWQQNNQELEANILKRSRNTKTEPETLSVRFKAVAERDQLRQQFDGSMFEGFAKGIREYVEAPANQAFGMMQNTARETAQAMAQGFKTFFFDLFEGRIKTLKDMLRGMLDFVKQIIAQVLAQLATIAVFKAISGAFGGGGSWASDPTHANAGGLIAPRHFAIGGTVPWVNNDSVPAMLTPGEYVVSRRGVAALDRLNQGDTSPMGSGSGSVTVNVVNSGRTDKPNVNVRKSMEGMVLDIIFRDVQSNGPLRALLKGA